MDYSVYKTDDKEIISMRMAPTAVISHYPIPKEKIIRNLQN